MTILTILLIFFMCFITLLILFDSAKNGITPTPTTSKEKAAALKLTESLHPSFIADLGAGFGTMAFPLAKQFPEAKVVAYETAVIPWIFLLIRNFLQPRANLSIRRKNFLKEDLSSYDLFYTYLYPKAMEQLQAKITHQRTTMISNCFAMPDWKPSLIWPVESKVNYSSIYLYRRN
ncbi:hypothetical protein [Halobacillus sp. B23F22_1]|uniref:hypothetical protein n=1 Tax=Halobacillus sp. B23F22_1 TaxID=3459514 RepID=UPI00373F449A